MTATPAATRPLWRERGFRSFWAAQTVSLLGDQVTGLAIPLIAVTTLHASAWQVSWLTALVWTPNLLALLLGSWIDRRTRTRRLMVYADLLRAAVLLTLPAAHLLGGVTLPQLYAAAALTGAGGVLFNTAYPPFFAHLVPPGAYLDANSKLSTSRSAAAVAGPALGGALVQALTAPFAVLADALSFIGSALLIGRVDVDEPAVHPDPASVPMRTRARDGVRFLAGHPYLRAGLGCATTINFFTFLAGSGLIVLFATRVLRLTPALIGLALGVGATGALLGALIAPALAAKIGVGRCIAVGAVLFPAPLAITAAAAGPLWARTVTMGLAEFLSGVGVMLFDVNLNALNATLTPDGMRSRSAGAYSTINYGVRPVASLAGGALASSLGLRATLLIGAVGGASSLLWLLRSPIPATRTLNDAAPTPSPHAHSEAG